MVTGLRFTTTFDRRAGRAANLGRDVSVVFPRAPSVISLDVIRQTYPNEARVSPFVGARHGWARARERPATPDAPSASEARPQGRPSARSSFLGKPFSPDVDTRPGLPRRLALPCGRPSETPKIRQSKQEADGEISGLGTGRQQRPDHHRTHIQHGLGLCWEPRA